MMLPMMNIRIALNLERISMERTVIFLMIEDFYEDHHPLVGENVIFPYTEEDTEGVLSELSLESLEKSLQVLRRLLEV